MTSLFLFGSLRHLPLLSAVLGRQVDEAELVPARLAGHAARTRADGRGAGLVPGAGDTVTGAVLRGLDGADLARLSFYATALGLTGTDVTVEAPEGAETARVFTPGPGVALQAARWDGDAWARDHGAMATRAAVEVMQRFETTPASEPASEIATLYPFIEARAWAHMLGTAAAPQQVRRKISPDDVEFLQQRPGFDGFFRLRAFTLRHRKFDGSWSGPIGREAFVAFDAALVLPYDPVSDQVLLIEQLRFGPLMRDDPAPWVLEPVAGLVDAGEDPAETARREAVEEAGLSLDDIRPMTRFYASPGYSSEFFHCFLGLCDLAGHKAGLGGLETEHEDIRTHILPFDRALELIDTGEINAGPLVTMLLWLARQRDGLRARA